MFAHGLHGACADVGWQAVSGHPLQGGHESCSDQPERVIQPDGHEHRQSYKDIFAITLIKTTSVFVIIGLFYLTGWV